MIEDIRDNFDNVFPAQFTDVPAPAATPGEVTGFFTDTTLCIGCKACEVACKQWNGLPADGLHFTGHSYDNTSHLGATTWRHVAFKEKEDEKGDMRWLMLSDVCKHCQDSPCQQSCPTGALIYNEFGDVYLQDDVCNGCGYCVSACPFGVLDRSKEDGHAHKCTLCYDRQKDGLTPACAKACPTASIQFGPLEQLREKARERVATLHERGRTDAYLYGADAFQEYAPLNSFFLLEDHPNEYNLPVEPPQPFNGLKKRYAWSFGMAAALTLAAGEVFRRSARSGKDSHA